MKKKSRQERLDDPSLIYYSPAEIADILSVSLRTVRMWINNGELPSVRFGGKNGRIIRVSHQDLKAFLDRHKVSKETP